MVRKRKRQRRRNRHRKINIMNNRPNNSSASGPNPNPAAPQISSNTKSQSQSSSSSSTCTTKNKNKNKNLQPGIANQPTSSTIIQDMFALSPEIVHIDDEDHHLNDLIIDLEADDDDHDLELQRALVYSSMLSGKQQAQEQEEEEEEVDVKQKGIIHQSFTLTSNPNPSFGTTSFHNSSMTGLGDSSVSFMAYCVICNDAKPHDSDSLLRAFKCGHRFCEDCINKYVAEKLQESIHGPIMCPGSKCKKPLSWNFLKRLVPERLLDQWITARVESSVLAQPLWLLCPFEDCAKPLVDDEKQFLIRACPHCWKIFCIRCQVSWHLGMTCHEFQQHFKEKEIERQIWAVRQFLALTNHRGPVFIIR